MLKILVIGLLLACGGRAASEKVKASPSAAAPHRWHLGAESVFAVNDGGGQVLPGIGIAVGKTPVESGFIFDAGLYVLSQMVVTPPAYFHGGYQFSPNWRLWGYAGLSVVIDGGREFFATGFPVLITGVEGEWLPLRGPVELSLLGGGAFAYFVIPLAPYVGTRLVVNLSDRFALQGLMRVLFSGSGLAGLGSAGIQVRL